MRGDDADAPAGERDVQMAFEQFDVGAAHVQRAVHMRERHRVGLAGDFPEENYERDWPDRFQPRDLNDTGRRGLGLN